MPSAPIATITTVEHAATLVHEIRDRPQHDWAHGDLSDEVTVPDIEVEYPGASVEQDLQLLAEPGEIGRIDRRLDGARACPLSPSHPLTVPL